MHGPLNITLSKMRKSSNVAGDHMGEGVSNIVVTVTPLCKGRLEPRPEWVSKWSIFQTSR